MGGASDCADELRRRDVRARMSRDVVRHPEVLEGPLCKSLQDALERRRRLSWLWRRLCPRRRRHGRVSREESSGCVERVRGRGLQNAEIRGSKASDPERETKKCVCVALETLVDLLLQNRRVFPWPPSLSSI